MWFQWPKATETFRSPTPSVNLPNNRAIYNTKIEGTLPISMTWLAIISSRVNDSGGYSETCFLNLYNNGSYLNGECCFIAGIENSQNTSMYPLASVNAIVLGF